MARTVMTASTAPAAPSRWPCIDLVDDIGMVLAAGPKAAFTARVSAASFICVEVPCALM